MTKVGKERGMAADDRGRFEAQVGPEGALLVGSPEEVAEKILRHSEALGGITRLTFQMDTAEVVLREPMASSRFGLAQWIGQFRDAHFGVSI